MKEYKKTVIYALILVFLIALFLLVFELSNHNLIIESVVEIFILVFGLILFPKFENNSSKNELKKGIGITLIYGIMLGSFIQVISPESELKTLISFLLFSFVYKYIILVGFAVSLLKFIYNTLAEKKRT